MNFFKQGWLGKEKLWKVTWLGYIGLIIVVVLLTISMVGTVGDNAMLFMTPVVLVVNIWGIVAMWRCAPNVNWRGWMYIARVLVVLTAVGWLLEGAGLL
jgi:hypothetical protein